MTTIMIALIAYGIDRLFGEFRFIKHPVIVMGDMISFFEKHCYKDSIVRGVLLVLFVITLNAFAAIIIESYLALLPELITIIVSAVIASMFMAHRMLYDSVNAILTSDDKKKALSQLVSRDTRELSESDIYKASIETYAENLNDGVIAPLFYLLLFGLPGIIIYKAINTLDSMVGYRNVRYEKFGKAAARLDDAANYIPARLTAVLISILSRKKGLFDFYAQGKKHDSPNAGHPITAMAQALDVRLGGDTSYFGTLKKKPFFGSGSETVTPRHLQEALAFRNRIDLSVMTLLLLTTLFYKGLS
ncbi:adenosylcobinamide-phosphate synthase CbiB [Sulfurovum sp.]|uniref:adenosylcobinamide-phosphate synthase CbiB n=1 Tax=Sulfurovum sp. TaxID=1969726 RepID=UPI002A368269|nr:adenosylcobinamide-phosphate synthase CbiB [Sulfurovum sp.]MDY0402926.1 adenosylcobinamide-phosphate synthase CbiB [Sulfurovum sp.]